MIGFARAFNTMARKPQHDKANRQRAVWALNDAVRIAIVLG
jgi:hypothetical protein